MSFRRGSAALFLTLPALLEAAEPLHLGGYVEFRGEAGVHSEPLQTDQELLRLELDRDLDRGSLSAHLVFQTALSPLNPLASVRPDSRLADILLQSFALGPELLPGDSLPPETDLLGLLQGLESFWASSYAPRDQMRLDRLQMKLFFDRADVTLGRQTVAWGTGYAWNPTDLWNQKSPLDPTAPKQGVTALRAEAQLGRLSGLDAIVAPGLEPSTTSFGLRWRSNLWSTDYSLSLARFASADRELLGLPKRLMLGFDMAGQLPLDVGYWVEGSANRHHAHSEDLLDWSSGNIEDSLFVQLDIGVDYTFEGGWYVSSEYYFNGLGEGDPGAYSVREFVLLSGGEMAGFARHYALAGLRKNFLDFWTLSLYAIGNFNDGSVALAPLLEYSWSDNMLCAAGARVLLGDPEMSEFASSWSSLFGEVRAFF